jgi:hypothetical protein
MKEHQIAEIGIVGKQPSSRAVGQIQHPSIMDAGADLSYRQDVIVSRGSSIDDRQVKILIR